MLEEFGAKLKPGLVNRILVPYKYLQAQPQQPPVSAQDAAPQACSGHSGSGSDDSSRVV
jgi:hypothetical protein|eukprot:evm.model.NODE_31173_length_31272_cov_26.593374.4